MKRLGLLAASVSVALALAATAGAYDRQPIPVASLYADGWGQSTTKAAAQLAGRYHGIRLIYCVGAVIVGDEQNSSWVDGVVRFWDKLVCAGYARSGHTFSLIYDAKAAYTWTIYRLKGVTLYDLY